MGFYYTGEDGKKHKAAGLGLPGKSAYQYAVDGGFTGTEEEFKTLFGMISNTNLLDKMRADIDYLAAMADIQL